MPWRPWLPDIWKWDLPRECYDWLADNPAVEFYSQAYTNDPQVIAKGHKPVAINQCIELDLFGQICSESMGVHQYSGCGGDPSGILERCEVLSKEIGGTCMKKPCITITLMERRGAHMCHRVHQIGDQFDFDTERGRLCPMAMHVAFPYVDILRYGGALPLGSQGDIRADIKKTQLYRKNPVCLRTN